MPLLTAVQLDPNTEIQPGRRLSLTEP